MKIPRRSVLLILCLFAGAGALVGPSVSATADSPRQDASANLFSLSSSSYAVHNLVSDGGVPADHTDPDLINPWGLVFNPTAVAWVADAETGVSTLYNGAGVKQSLVVTIPTPPNGTPTMRNTASMAGLMPSAAMTMEKMTIETERGSFDDAQGKHGAGSRTLSDGNAVDRPLESARFGTRGDFRRRQHPPRAQPEQGWRC